MRIFSLIKEGQVVTSDQTEWNLIVLSYQLYGHVNLFGQHPTFSSLFNSQETEPLVNLRSIKTSSAMGALGRSGKINAPFTIPLPSLLPGLLVLYVFLSIIINQP